MLTRGLPSARNVPFLSYIRPPVTSAKYLPVVFAKREKKKALKKNNNECLADKQQWLIISHARPQQFTTFSVLGDGPSAQILIPFRYKGIILQLLSDVH